MRVVVTVLPLARALVHQIAGPPTRTPAETSNGLAAHTHTKRLQPTTTFCNDNEVWLGRLCDRTTDSAGMWVERCWVPFTYDELYNSWRSRWDHEPLPSHTRVEPGKEPDAAWVAQLVRELQDMSAPPTPGAERVDKLPFGEKLRKFGTVRDTEHHCPSHFACMQSLDTSYLPHVFCRSVPWSWVHRFADKEWDVWLEPYGEKSGFMVIDVSKIVPGVPPVQNLRPGVDADDVALTKRTFNIDHDIDQATLSIVAYDPATMEMVRPAMPWDVDLASYKDPCATWSDVLEPSGSCSPVTLQNIKKGTVLTVRMAWEYKKLVAKAVTYILVLWMAHDAQLRPAYWDWRPGWVRRLDVVP